VNLDYPVALKFFAHPADHVPMINPLAAPTLRRKPGTHVRRQDRLSLSRVPLQPEEKVTLKSTGDKDHDGDSH